MDEQKMNNWVWPLPNQVPWDLADYRVSYDIGRKWPEEYNPKFSDHGLEIKCPIESFVHAVEAGTVVECSIDHVVIQGESRVVYYDRTSPYIERGQSIKAGQRIGRTNSPALGLWVAKPPFPSGFRKDCVPLGHPDVKFIDPYPFLLPAWCRVTNRFHRDAPRPPNDPVEVKALVRWILENDLWTSPIGGGFHESVFIDFVYVDPTTETILGDEDTRNTAFRVWLEPCVWEDQSQDPDVIPPNEGWTDENKWDLVGVLNLHTWGKTVEEAIINLAQMVKFFYQDNGEPRDAPEQCGGHFDMNLPDEPWVSHCRDAGDGFCAKCGYLIESPEVEN